MNKSWKIDDGVALFLSEESAKAQNWRALVSSRECERADGMGSPERAATFLQSRVLLRRELGKRLCLAHAAVPIEIDAAGKPFLTGNEIVFSISHAHSHILIGIMDGKGALGVDLEFIDPARDIAKLARRVLSEKDWRQIESATPDKRLETAFRLWCLYEARLKRGAGDGAVSEQTGLLENGLVWAASYI